MEVDQNGLINFMSCLICERIEMIKNNINPYFVIELDTGYVVMADHQKYKGYVCFLCKMHVTELHLLPYKYKVKHLEEMSIVSEAIYHVFNADKMNHAMLGNLDSHVHWHLIPRKKDDAPAHSPIWRLPDEELFDDSYRPSKGELSNMASALKAEIIRLIECPVDSQ